ncbi:MAG: hypothetical protein QOH26_155, partial [Actinomycetota bacterium]|nr:hypothetical protein [Actinomycetota bacterium]
GVAHDFNNLLAVVINYAGFVAEELGPDHPSLGDVQEIMGAGRRGAALTRQLLTFSRKDIAKVEVLSINDAVIDLEPLLRQLIPENIELSLRLDPESLNVVMDSSRLGQILMNLSVNAKDAISGQGELVISTTNVTLDPASEALGLDAGRYVMLGVSDTGIGVPDEIRNRIFEPFFTTKGHEKGTGLGLATVYAIVSQAGGAIHMESEAGLGTRFAIFLPVTSDEAAVEPSDQPPSEIARDVPALDLLVVEDEASVRAVTSRILRAAGHKVVEASNGIEALPLLGETSFDVLVSDVVMPGMSGLELRRQVDVPTVLISGYPDGAIRDEGELPTNTELVMKPFTPEELLDAISRVVSSEVHT